MLKVIFIGDIIGKIGRKAVIQHLNSLKKKYLPDLVLANGENIAHGIGFTHHTLAEVREAGVDLFTSGNHAWSKGSADAILDDPDPMIIRPANYPKKKSGLGLKTLSVKKISQNKILVVNLLGKVFIDEPVTCPFKSLERIAQEYQDYIIVVDFHAEATSEKLAMGHFAAGKVAAVLGTHTHVPTCDARILDRGTGYVSDIGMVGYYDSVIGADKRQVINMFLKEGTSSKKHDLPETGECQFNAVYLEIDVKTKQTKKIIRVDDIVKVN